VNLILEALVPSALQLQQTVFASGTPPVWDALSFGQQDCSFQPSATLSLGSSDGSSADHYSDVPPNLLQSIETSDPGTKEIEICGMELGESGCRILARALSLNTCVTTLRLVFGIAPAGAALPFGALALLTTMTHLNLNSTNLYPAGAVQLCSVLPHLMALTELKLSQHVPPVLGGCLSLLCTAAPHRHH
jgi:hypothetical protein